MKKETKFNEVNFNNLIYQEKNQFIKYCPQDILKNDKQLLYTVGKYVFLTEQENLFKIIKKIINDDMLKSFILVAIRNQKNVLITKIIKNEFLTKNADDFIAAALNHCVNSNNHEIWDLLLFDEKLKFNLQKHLLEAGTVVSVVKKYNHNKKFFNDLFIKKKLNINSYNSEAFKEACINNEMDIVNLLFDKAKHYIEDLSGYTFCLEATIYKDNLEAFKFLFNNHKNLKFKKPFELNMKKILINTIDTKLFYQVSTIAEKILKFLVLEVNIDKSIYDCLDKKYHHPSINDLFELRSLKEKLDTNLPFNDKKTTLKI